VTFLALIIVGNYATPHHFVLDPAETRKWAYGSSSFTSKLYIIDYSKEVSKYFLSTEPVLESTPSSDPQTHAESVVLDGGDWLHFQNYLNKNSIVTATFTVSSGSAHMYLIKSTAAFDKWADEPDENKNSPLETKYSSNSQTSSMSYTIATDEDYYIVFDNDKDYQTASLDFSISVSAAQYILTGESPVCTSGEQVCDIPIADSDPRKYLVLVAPSNGTDPDLTFELDIYNEPNWVGIGLFWVLLPSMTFLACCTVPSAVSRCRGGGGAAHPFDGSSLGVVTEAGAGEDSAAPPHVELGQTGFLVIADAQPVTGTELALAHVHASPDGDSQHQHQHQHQLKGSESVAVVGEMMPLLGHAPQPSAPPASK
jgi:hypothetical protein